MYGFDVEQVAGVEPAVFSLATRCLTESTLPAVVGVTRFERALSCSQSMWVTITLHPVVVPISLAEGEGVEPAVSCSRLRE